MLIAITIVALVALGFFIAWLLLRWRAAERLRVSQIKLEQAQRADEIRLAQTDNPAKRAKIRERMANRSDAIK